jgi:cytochrome P450
MTVDASDPCFYEEANRDAYLQIHATDPVYWVDARYSMPFWNVCCHDLIRQVAVDSELFTTEYGVHLENSSFQTKGSVGSAKALKPAPILPAEEHRRVRRPLNPHFRRGEIAKMEDAIRAIVTDLLDDIRPGCEVDFMGVFAARVPLRVTAILLGVSPERERDFALWADAILTSFEPGSEPDWAAIGELGQFFAAEIAARRSTPRDDLITAMLATDLAEQEVLMWCCMLLAAGVETTGNLIGGGMDLLMRHPDQLARLRCDGSLMRPAVSEMLRVITPGRYIRRTATADAQLGAHHIKEGDVVAMNFTVANYDPALFTDPLTFDIDRNPPEGIAFSYGQHRCIGMAVARLESTIAFEELLARFPRIEPRGPATVRPSTATAVIESLPVLFAPG